MKKNGKIVIYSVLPRLFDNKNISRIPNGSIKTNGCGKFSGFSHEALKAIRDFGVTHIWYVGVLQHASTTPYETENLGSDFSGIVKGKAGSPYAITDYYDVDADLADIPADRMREFDELIIRNHNLGLKVIIDFVPNHVARQYKSKNKPPHVHDLGEYDNKEKAFDPQNNFYYLPGQTLTLTFGANEEDYLYSEFPAKVSGNDRFTAQVSEDDWYETVKLNYGVDYMDNKHTYFDPIPDTWHRMLEILQFWASKGVDGFRCDMAEMVPVEFWRWCIPQIKSVYPVIFIAEIYQSLMYRSYIEAGVDFLYDKVGVYDTLRRIINKESPVSSFGQARALTADFTKHMLYFLENHDEQRIASDFFAGNAGRGLPAVALAALCGKNPFMLYFAQELGERAMDKEGFSGRDGRTTIFDYWSLDTMQRWINEGKYNEDRLTTDERRVRRFYKKIFADICTEEAISFGDFYDLCPANMTNDSFRASRHYSFMRYWAGEIILVVCNFSNTQDKLSIIIPQEAFEAISLKENIPLRATDLFTGITAIDTLTYHAPYEIIVAPYRVRVIKFSKQE